MSARGLTVLALICGGCAAEPAWVEGEIGVWRSGLTVGAAGGCSTAIVAGLTQQLIDEQNCLRPGALVSFAATPNLSISSGVNPYLEQPAADALARAATHAGPIDITSAFRTLAQQYLLYKWQGMCGIQIAAVPGGSNHETGIAIDVGNHDAMRSALEAEGWVWYGSGDVVHFDYLAGGTVDLRGDSVLAFQKLWNLNHPNDTIAEDGSYGPMTEARLAASDVNGFAKGSTCASQPPPAAEYAATLAGHGGPGELAPGAEGDFYIDFKNTGTATWKPGATNLGTDQPHDRASALAAAGWISPARPATVDHDTPPGDVGRFAFHALAPREAHGSALSENFALVEEGVTWFGPGAQFTLELDVAPFAAESAAAALAPAPEPGSSAAGCEFAGRRPSSAAFAIAALVLALRLRRRPR